LANWSVEEDASDKIFDCGVSDRKSCVALLLQAAFCVSFDSEMEIKVLIWLVATVWRSLATDLTFYLALTFVVVLVYIILSEY